MFEVIAVTNRLLCKTDFMEQIEKIARAGVSSMILREKDLPPDEYEALARQAMEICGRYGVPCTLHHFIGAAKRIGAERIHLSLGDLEENPAVREDFSVVGVSVHSLRQARRAAALGADYVSAGHVFETNCKKGLEPRGIPFLKEVCAGLAIPVYGIGGIGAENIRTVREAGAAGACLMSAFMAGEPEKLAAELKNDM